MRLNVSHSNRYTYDHPVEYGLQQLRLTPKERDDQKTINWEIEIEGGKSETTFTDQHKNLVHLVSIDPGRKDITIGCAGEVEITNSTGVIGEHKGYAPLWYFKRSTDLTKSGPLVQKLCDSLYGDFSGDVDKLHALSQGIRDKVAYEIGKTDAETPAENALETGFGVCQDHAHIFLSAAREMGFPARYVSGYLMMNDRVDQDATHAWAEVYLDALGWVGFDISNGYSPDERYIRVATGLDFKEAAPISGMRYGSGSEDMVVSLQVQQ